MVGYISLLVVEPISDPCRSSEAGVFSSDGLNRLGR
jgi:hypothetical protein